MGHFKPPSWPHLVKQVAKRQRSKKDFYTSKLFRIIIIMMMMMHQQRCTKWLDVSRSPPGGLKQKPLKFWSHEKRKIKVREPLGAIFAQNRLSSQCNVSTVSFGEVATRSELKVIGKWIAIHLASKLNKIINQRKTTREFDWRHFIWLLLGLDLPASAYLMTWQ